MDIIRPHACETGASGEHAGAAESDAEETVVVGYAGGGGGGDEEELHNDDNKNNIKRRRIRKKRRKLLNNVEDADPEMENQEMNRVLERFRAGRMRVDGTRNIFHDPEDGKAARR